MTDQIVTIHTAKLAKDKGFNWSTFSYYIGNNTYRDKFTQDHNKKSHITDKISAPTQTQLHRWLREVHEIDVLVTIYPKKVREKNNWGRYTAYVVNEKNNPPVDDFVGFGHSYEEAFEQGLRHGLEMISTNTEK